MPNKANLFQQALADIEFWENNTATFFKDFNDWANAYRMLPPSRRTGTRNFSNTRSAETARATETLTTLIYRMMTAADPNFLLLSRHGGVDNSQLVAPTEVLKDNQVSAQYKRKLIKAIRSGVLFGSSPVELPWEQNQMFGKEGPGFMPRSLLQFAFDPFVAEMDQSSWFGTIDFKSNEELRRLALNSPDVWEDKFIIKGLDAKASETFNVWIAERLNTAGYNQIVKGLNELITWWGRPADEPDKMWVVSILNRKAIVRMHESPYNDVDGMAPFEFGHFSEIELESFGYGVGKFTRQLQAEIDANRNRYTDILTFSLFNMWEIPKGAGIDRVLIKPLGIIRPAEAGQVRPLQPPLEAAEHGIALEQIFKDDFRALTGATPNLQAEVTKASATESALVQGESIRKISVIAEIMAEPFVRRTMLRWHARNMKFMDKPQWFGIAGQGKPQLVTNSDIQIPLDVAARITTDKDFKPQRIEALNFAFQSLAALKQNSPDTDVSAQLQALANELLRTLGVKVAEPVSAVQKMQNNVENIADGKNQLVQELSESAPTNGRIQVTPGGPI